MSLNKTHYILRSFSKITNKRWEYFIISRVLHHLDDDIEFVTQQLVRRPDGSRALTDLFFPQFNIHLEIDEPHHQKQKINDLKREQDIVQATGHRVERIGITSSDKKEKELNQIRDEADAFSNLILELKKTKLNDGTFSAWNFDHKYSSKTIISRGYMSVDDNVVFRTQVEAMRCFGFKGKGWQRGGWRIPDGTGDEVWFPRLYQHGMWHNELINDGKRICERALNEEGVSSIKLQIERGRLMPEKNYIVFAKACDSLGFNLLRYVGTFQMNFDNSTKDNLIFDRVREIEPVRSSA